MGGILDLDSNLLPSTNGLFSKLFMRPNKARWKIINAKQVVGMFAEVLGLDEGDTQTVMGFFVAEYWKRFNSSPGDQPCVSIWDAMFPKVP